MPSLVLGLGLGTGHAQGVHRPLRMGKTRPSAIRWISHALAVGVLGVGANLGLAVALLLSVGSESACWRVGSRVAQGLWSYMQSHLENRLNAAPALTFSGDVDLMQPDEGALVIANHQGYADYYLVHALASRAPVGPSGGVSARPSNGSSEKKTSDQSGMTIERTHRPISPGWGMLGRCRYFAKQSLVWQVPVFGWSFWAIGMILVSRNWTRDAGLIRRAFARVKKNRFPCWIVSYLEGTRVTPRKVEQSRAYAREHGKAELRHVLLPRTKGFVATVQELRDSHIRYVYDLTLCYGLPQPERDLEHPPDSAVSMPAGMRRRHADRPTLPVSEDSTESVTVSASASEQETDAPEEKGKAVVRPPRRGAPGLSEVLSIGDLAGAGYSFHVHLERHAIADLPTDEDGLKQWVEDAWVRKDAFLERWYSEIEGRS